MLDLQYLGFANDLWRKKCTQHTFGVARIHAEHFIDTESEQNFCLSASKLLGASFRWSEGWTPSQTQTERIQSGLDFRRILVFFSFKSFLSEVYCSVFTVIFIVSVIFETTVYCSIVTIRPWCMSFAKPLFTESLLHTR